MVPESEEDLPWRHGNLVFPHGTLKLILPMKPWRYRQGDCHPYKHNSDHSGGTTLELRSAEQRLLSLRVDIKQDESLPVEQLEISSYRGYCEQPAYVLTKWHTTSC